MDILVATPGRLLDLCNQGHIDLRSIEVLVLDEADRMLDMGFIHDIRKIIAKLPTVRQTLLFSATIPAEIQDLAHSLLRKPVTVRVTPQARPADRIEQSVYFVEKRNKPQLLAHLVETLPMIRAIVFTRTKHGADKVVRHLHKAGIRAEAIHGNKSQNNRERALENFRCEKTPVLVATDIASRGIDVDGITHVVNYDLSHEPETYIHRIGRTARAGAAGTAVAFCDREELPNLRAIEKLLRRPIPVAGDQPEYSTVPQADAPRPQPSRRPARDASPIARVMQRSSQDCAGQTPRRIACRTRPARRTRTRPTRRPPARTAPPRGKRTVRRSSHAGRSSTPVVCPVAAVAAGAESILIRGSSESS